MFRKRMRKQDYVEENRKIYKDKKRNLRLNIKFNARFVKKSEFYSMTKIYDELANFHIAAREAFIITAASTMLGNRKNQQDSYYVTKTSAVTPFRLSRSFGVVCDGMGGLEAGDRASDTAVSMMKLAVDKLPTKKVDVPHFFSQMLDYIDYEINHWEDLTTNIGSGTTFAAVLIENKRMYWASVGDSSVYLYQQGRVIKVNIAHNYMLYLNRLVENGEITHEQAENDPQKRALLSYVGMGGIAYRDINPKPYVMKNGDVIVICTDGITDTLSDKELSDIIRENIDDMYLCSKKITDAVKEKHTVIQDNATVVLMQYAE